ncbi:MAG: ABC transporter ATP-binding protein [Patescibacteria group bacterium]|nr:ABC transporter ATP-binding protein [Patescibacteria group bacterium]
MPQPLFRTENLSVIYNLGKSSETPAILDINIEIYSGEYIIIYGPSGCGKSTLLFCLAGIQFPTRGKVYFQDQLLDIKNLRQMSDHRKFNVGMIFQFYNLIPTLNVLDNVMLPRLFGKTVRDAIKEKALSQLDRFGIKNLAFRYPGELSGGQAQRVAIARALMYDPLVLLADEPIGNLDSASAQVVMDLLAEINQKEKKTIILVTHQPQYLHLAHRVFYMRDGEIFRTEINPEKKQLIPMSELKELVAKALPGLARLYPHLTETQLKAKALAQYLITDFTLPEQERLEKVLEKRITKEISEEKFKELLDLPFDQGGIGLYHQTAQRFTKNVEHILAQAEFLEAKVSPKPPKSEIEVKAEQIRRYLLDSYAGTLELEEELRRLDSFIQQRIQRQITSKQFQKYLDLPLRKGGVGLNKRTAKDFARKLEIILAQRS